MVYSLKTQIHQVAKGTNTEKYTANIKCKNMIDLQNYKNIKTCLKTVNFQCRYRYIYALCILKVLSQSFWFLPLVNLIFLDKERPTHQRI